MPREVNPGQNDKTKSNDAVILEEKKICRKFLSGVGGLIFLSFVSFNKELLSPESQMKLGLLTVSRQQAVLFAACLGLAH